MYFIGSDNGLVLKRQQPFIWTFMALFSDTYSSHGIIELIYISLASFMHDRSICIANTIEMLCAWLHYFINNAPEIPQSCTKLYIYVAISIDVYNFFMLNVPFGVVQLNKRLNKTEEIVNYIKTLAPEAGGRLNKKDGLTRYGDSHVKDKTS